MSSLRSERKGEHGDRYTRHRLRGDEDAEPVEAGADSADLVLVRLDERQPQAADLVAEQVQRRLDRDRIADDLQQLVGRAQRLVELLRAGYVATLVRAHHLF